MVAKYVMTDCLRILRRLVENDEFADEIERMALNPRSVPVDVVQDTAILARARAKYEPIADLHEQMSAHTQVRPKAWPDSWHPSTREKRLLTGVALCWLALFLVDPLAGDLLWAPLRVVLPMALFGMGVTSLLLGLPHRCASGCGGRWTTCG